MYSFRNRPAFPKVSMAKGWTTPCKFIKTRCANPDDKGARLIIFYKAAGFPSDDNDCPLLEGAAIVQAPEGSRWQQQLAITTCNVITWMIMLVVSLMARMEILTNICISYDISPVYLSGSRGPEAFLHLLGHEISIDGPWPIWTWGLCMVKNCRSPGKDTGFMLISLMNLPICSNLLWWTSPCWKKPFDLPARGDQGALCLLCRHRSKR